jgi:hypothetical protein
MQEFSPNQINIQDWQKLGQWVAPVLAHNPWSYIGESDFFARQGGVLISAGS